ncbi:MAG: hypothetical protein QME41_02135 [Actinomycetota bacterium]|nr:hypothetical protein [Actinomycetota bacterium]
MELYRFIVTIMTLIILLSGCTKAENSPLPQDGVSTSEARAEKPIDGTTDPSAITRNNGQSNKRRDISSDGFAYVTDQEVFQQVEADGREIWFDKRYTGDGEVLTYKGTAYSRGLAIDHLSPNGINDPRTFAFVKYSILKGEYSKVTGLLFFDDTSKVLTSSKLIAYANDKKVFESAEINQALTSTEVNFELPKHVQTIGFRFETSLSNGAVPRLVFADIKAIKAK